MDQSSDHLPISTKLFLQCKPATVQPRRAWKMMDMEKLKEVLENAPLLQAPRSVAEIDVEVENVQAFLCTVIDCTVPWAKFSEWSKPFWNTECNAVMEQTRAFRKTWSRSRELKDWQAYMKANDRKQKVIAKAKRLHYWQVINKATASSRGL